MRKSPGIATLAAITLGIGIGANATLFNLADKVLLRPLPGVGDARQLVTLGSTYQSQGFNTSSWLNYRDLQEQNRVFLSVAAIHPLAASVTEAGSSERVAGEMVTANYFQTLAVDFAAGGGFSGSEDGAEGSVPNVVIGYGLWERAFARDPGICGRQLAIDGHPFTIVGVTARGFIGADAMARAEDADLRPAYCASFLHAG